MIRTFTQNDLVRYAYQETSKKETEEIENALLCDAKLEAKLKEINLLKLKLDLINESPSKRVIDNILNYSKYLNAVPKK